MPAFYNDNDPFNCQWLRNLIRDGLIPEGTVDERPVQEIEEKDLQGYEQHHFFAGIAGWPLALQLAGWDSTRPVFTGSVPCQPFSQAGKGKEEKDSRDLWPHFLRLIALCRPPVIFGEQIAGDGGYRWLARVHTDLEQEGYCLGSADLPVACVGSPHIRQRLFWVAVPQCSGIRPQRPGEAPGATAGVQGENGQRQRVRPDPGSGRGTADGVSRLANPGRTSSRQSDSGNRPGEGREQQQPDEPGRCSRPGRLDESNLPGCGKHGRNGTAAEEHSAVECTGNLDRLAVGDGQPGGQGGQIGGGSHQGSNEESQPGPGSNGQSVGISHTDSRRRLGQDVSIRQSQQGQAEVVQPRPLPWDEFTIIPCLDGKLRRISFEPGVQPLVNGLPRSLAGIMPRVLELAPDPCIARRIRTSGKGYRNVALRGYGNAINPFVAALFIRAFMETEYA